MAVSFGLSKVGLEVYTTTDKDEEKKKEEEEKNKDSEKESDSTSDKKEDKEEETPEIISPEIGEEGNKFKLENGPIKQINYIGELFSDSFEQDYTDISSNASISLPIGYLKYFYKGRKVCLKKGIQNDTKYKWKDMKSAVLGFVTEITYNRDKVDIRINGMDKLLDVDKQFTFKQTKRSEIVTKIIEASGLKPKVDVTGLEDDVTDFTNVTTTKSSSNSDVAGGQGKEIDELVAGWCQGKNSDLEKAKAIHFGLREYGIRYRKYYDTEYETPENCLKHARDPGLNCGDCAILTTACMLSGGLDAYIALRCDSKHYFTVITIDGTKYYSDLTWSEGNLSQREWNDTWEHDKCGNKYGNGTRIE